MLKFKCYHLNNDLWKLIWRSWGWLDYLGFLDRTKDIAEKVEDWSEADIIVWFQSNLNAFGWVLLEKNLKKYYEICEYSKTKPILYMFSDFEIMMKIQDKMIKRFWKEVPVLNKDNVYVVHYYKKSEELKEYWNKQKWNFKLDNFIYRDLSLNYFFGEKSEIKDEYINEVLYIGHDRKWMRNNFLRKFDNITIVGKWKDRYIIKWNKYLPWMSWDKIQWFLNDYFAQITTYDDIGIKYACTNYRILVTVSAWMLPIIDSRLKYLDLPEEFDCLFVDNNEDLEKIRLFSPEKRRELITKLIEYYEEYKKEYNYNSLFDLILKQHETKSTLPKND